MTKIKKKKWMVLSILELKKLEVYRSAEQPLPSMSWAMVLIPRTKRQTDRQTGVGGKEGEEGAAPQAAAVCCVRRWRLKGNTRKQKDEERQGKTRGVWEVVKRLHCY